MNKYSTSTKGVNLIKRFEGCYLEAYQDPANKWTIGYGHTGNVDGKAIKKGMKISNQKAIMLLKSDLKKYERIVKKCAKVSITQNQFDALVSFTYNIGEGNFTNSTLVKKLNNKDIDGASNEFLRWDKADTDGDGDLEVLKGLTKRRIAEKNLFDLK